MSKREFGDDKDVGGLRAVYCVIYVLGEGANSWAPFLRRIPQRTIRYIFCEIVEPSPKVDF